MTRVILDALYYKAATTVSSASAKQKFGYWTLLHWKFMLALLISGTLNTLSYMATSLRVFSNPLFGHTS